MSGLAWFVSSPVLHLFTLDATKASRQVFVGFKFERGGAVFVTLIRIPSRALVLFQLQTNALAPQSFLKAYRPGILIDSFMRGVTQRTGGEPLRRSPVGEGRAASGAGGPAAGSQPVRSAGGVHDPLHSRHPPLSSLLGIGGPTYRNRRLCSCGYRQWWECTTASYGTLAAAGTASGL